MVLMGGKFAFAHLVTQFPPQIPFVRIEVRHMFKLQDGNGLDAVIAGKVDAHDGPLYMLQPRQSNKVATGHALAYYGLEYAATACLAVEDLVYRPYFYDLCPVRKRG